MAKYAAEGVRVVLVCATGGEEGDILNPRMDRPGIKERMTELRRAELETACDLLGVARVYHLGYRDSGMPESEANDHPNAFWKADMDEATGKLVEIIRAERPEVMLSYDPHKGGYQHPDHIRVHDVGLRAWQEAGVGERFPSAGAPWSVSKLYFFATFTKRRFQMLNDAVVAQGKESPYAGWLENWDSMGFEEPEITTQIDVGEFIDLRTKALLAHATQIDPDSFWFAIPDEVHKQIYPWEDYSLMDARVETKTPEDDLFGGIGKA